MKKRLIMLILVTTILLINNSYAQAENGLPFSIEAQEHITFYEAEDIIYAAGEVFIEYGEDSLRADQVKIDLEAELFIAQGNVLLIQGEQEIKGESVEYDYNKREGRLLAGEAQAGKLFFRGEAIDLDEQGLIVKDSYLTPCGQDIPYYALQAESLKVYPDDRLEASGVWLLVRDRRVVPLPTYVATLDGTEIDQEISGIPRPRAGYNRADGFYGSLAYHHYVNPELSGDIFVKGTSRNRSGFDLDYTYNPAKYFKLGSGIGYRQHLGWHGRLNLNNNLGFLNSDLAYDYYYEDDEDDDNYQEGKWDASWNLESRLAGIDLTANFQDGDEKDKIHHLYTARKQLDNYYAGVRFSKNKEFNYRPELTLGVADFDLGSGNLLNSAYSIGQIGFTGEEVRREKMEFSFANKAYALGDRANLNWLFDFNDISYDRQDEYRSYQFELGLDSQPTPESKFTVDYSFFDEFGKAVISDDALIADGEGIIGRRHYLASNLGNSYQVSNSLQLTTQLAGGINLYPEQSYSFASAGLGAKYKLDELSSLRLGYNYLTDNGDIPERLIARDEQDLENELTAGYNFVTSKEYPAWQADIETGYDFNEGELSKFNYSIRRELDCLAVELEVEQLERSFDFSLEFKY